MPDLRPATAVRHSEAMPRGSAAAVLCAPIAETTIGASIDSPPDNRTPLTRPDSQRISATGARLRNAPPAAAMVSPSASANFAGPPIG